jgi:hypothetical protein
VSEVRLVFVDCLNAVGDLKMEAQEAYDAFRDYGDALMLGEAIPVEYPQHKPDSHIVRISVLWYPADIKKAPLPVLAVFRACDHVMQTIEAEEAEESTGLVQAKHQIIVPSKKAGIPK